MAVAYVDGATYSNANAVADYPCPAPTTGGAAAVGDFLVFNVVVGTPDTTVIPVTPPTGVSTLISPTISGATTSTIQTSVYYKALTSADLSVTTWDFVLGTAQQGSAIVARFRGVDTANPFAVASPSYSVFSTTSSGTTKTAPAVTTTIDNALPISGDSIRSGSQTITSLTSGWTTGPTTIGAGLGRGAAIAYANAAKTPAGTTGTVVWTASSSANGTAWQTALAPASGPPPVAAYSGSLTASGAGLVSLVGNPSSGGSADLTGSGALGAGGGQAASGAEVGAGSGALALTGAAQYRGTLALSGLGTTGQSSLVATGGSVAFSGSGAQGGSASVSQQPVATLGGLGSLSLSGVRQIGGALSCLGEGVLSLFGVKRESLHLFKTPTRIERPSGRGFGRFVKNRVGITVLKTGDFYREVSDPTNEDLADADVVYLGGHEYKIEDAEAQALTLAGYIVQSFPNTFLFPADALYPDGEDDE